MTPDRRRPAARLARNIVAACLVLAGTGAHAQDETDVAKQLANPIASLISVPFQLNVDSNLGADELGDRSFVNIQPVIPVSIGEDWNMISRTILPVVDQQGVPFPEYSEFGLGDTVQSLFFSPKQPAANGWIWGAGPVFLLPTATDRFLGSEKWGVGPTAVALRQTGRWTYGGLANHIESFAGESGRSDVSATFLQPFLTYITPTQTTFALNTETTYDWESGDWSVPINLQVNQLTRFGKQLVQVGVGVRYWAAPPHPGADGWGLRVNFILVYPK